MSLELLRLLFVANEGSKSDQLRSELSQVCDLPLSLEYVVRTSAAEEKLQRQDFDAVILDMSGQEETTGTAIRRVHAEASDTPVIIISANHNSSDSVKAIREGAQDCLLPDELTGSRLLYAILHAIERNQTERDLRRANQTLARRVEERTGYVSLLQNVAIIANEADTVEGALHAAVNRICHYMDWPVGHAYSITEIVPEAKPVDVWYLSIPGQFWPFREASQQAPSSSSTDTSIRAVVSAGGTPLWVVDVTAGELGSSRAAAARDCGLSTGFAFPVFLNDEVVAILEFFSTETSEPDDGFLSVMSHVGTQLGRVVERRRLQQQLIEAAWQKQRELGQDLHDGLGQELTGIGMLADSLRRRIHSTAPQHAEAADELVHLIRRSQQNLRRVSKGLLPVDVDAEGLRAALEELASGIESRCGIHCRLHSEGDVLISDNYIATHLFRIAQEAVHNAVKHARPQHIEIDLKRNDGSARLQVRDDGIGIGEPDRQVDGIGMKTMKYRADVIDAALDIRSADNGGTQVTCLIRPKE